MVLILIVNENENYCLYFIKEFNNSQEIPVTIKRIKTNSLYIKAKSFMVHLLIS